MCDTKTRNGIPAPKVRGEVLEFRFARQLAGGGDYGVPTQPTPLTHAPAPPGPAPAPAPGTPAVAPPGPAPAPAPPAPASAPPGPAPAPAPGAPAVAPPGPAPAPGAPAPGAPVPGAGVAADGVVIDVVVVVVEDVLLSSPLSSPPPQADSVKLMAAAAIPVVTEKRRKVKRSVMVQSRFCEWIYLGKRLDTHSHPRQTGPDGAKASAREHQRALDLLNRLRDLDPARAGFRAVERRAATPDAVDLVEDVEALGGGLIAAVEDEPVRVDDRGGPEIRPLAPIDGAAGGAARAQDALGRVVVAGPVGRALDPLAGRRIAAGDQVRLDRPVGVEERLHVHHQILLHRQAA